MRLQLANFIQTEAEHQSREAVLQQSIENGSDHSCIEIYDMYVSI